MATEDCDGHNKDDEFRPGRTSLPAGLTKKRQELSQGPIFGFVEGRDELARSRFRLSCRSLIATS